jgi:hypothetical protein
VTLQKAAPQQPVSLSAYGAVDEVIFTPLGDGVLDAVLGAVTANGELPCAHCSAYSFGHRFQNQKGI